MQMIFSINIMQKILKIVVYSLNSALKFFEIILLYTAKFYHLNRFNKMLIGRSKAASMNGVEKLRMMRSRIIQGLPVRCRGIRICTTS